MKITSFVWLLLSAALLAVLIEQGRMIGGVGYFVHVGRGLSAALQVAVIAGCALLSAAMWRGISSVKFLAFTVAAGSAIIFLSLFGRFFPLPIQLLLSQFSPATLSFGAIGIALPAVVTVFALGTAIYFTNHKSNDSKRYASRKT